MTEETTAILHNDFSVDCSVRVADANEVLCEVSVDLADDVRTLKKQIRSKTGIAELQQHLCILDAPLYDRELLSAIIVMGGITVMQLTHRRPEVVSWLEKVRDDTVKKRKAVCLSEAPHELLNDSEFMFAAVQEHRLALKFASTTMQGNHDVVKAAVLRSGVAIRFASGDLKDDFELALIAVKQDGWALEHVSARLQEDRKIVSAAIEENGHAFEFAAPSLRSDRALAMVAVGSAGMMLMEAGPDLRNDVKLATAAVQQDWEVIKYIDPKLRADRDLALAAISSHHPRAQAYEYGEALKHVAPELAADRSFLFDALRVMGNCFRFMPLELRSDRELARAAVQQNGMVLAYMSPELQDLDIAIAAVQQNIQAIQHVKQEFMDDVMKALEDLPRQENLPRQEKDARSDARNVKDPKLQKHFKMLGLPVTATPEEVRKRYRQLALDTHPDKQRGNSEDTGEQFVLISNAYQAIKEELLGG